MVKKKASKTYVSKGIVGHPKRTPHNKPNERLLNQVKAWREGKDVKLSVYRESTKDSGSPKIDAKEVWGRPFAKQQKESS